MAYSNAGKWIVLACAVAGAACTHQLQPAIRGASQAWPTAAPQRRVQNAVDAGDGNVQMQGLRRRLAANADDLEARMSLAELYRERGYSDLALEHYRFAAARFPDSLPVTEALVRTLRELGTAGEALRAVQQSLARHSGGSWELRSLEGILEDDEGRLAEAEAAHRAALALAPGRSALHNNLGYNLLLQGKAEAAAAEFRAALEIDPHARIARNNLAAALAAQSHPLEALAEWRKSSDAAAAHSNLAAVLIEQGRYPEARAELEAALALGANFAPALANLRLVAEKDGQPAAVAARRPASKRKNAVRVAAAVTPAAGGK